MLGDAFAYLTDVSQRTNTRVVDVAADVMGADGGGPDDAHAARRTVLGERLARRVRERYSPGAVMAQVEAVYYGALTSGRPWEEQQT